MIHTRSTSLLVASILLCLMAISAVSLAKPSASIPLLARQDVSVSGTLSSSPSSCETESPSQNDQAASSRVSLRATDSCYQSIVGGQSPIGPLSSELGATLSAINGSVSSVQSGVTDPGGGSSTMMSTTTSEAMTTTSAASPVAPSTSDTASSAAAGAATPASTSDADRTQPVSQSIGFAMTSLLLVGVMTSQMWL